jgi:hypothetical protein
MTIRLTYNGQAANLAEYNGKVSRAKGNVRRCREWREKYRAMTEAELIEEWLALPGRPISNAEYDDRDVMLIAEFEARGFALPEEDRPGDPPDPDFNQPEPFLPGDCPKAW